jgi:AraC-like DNA-binding protein
MHVALHALKDDGATVGELANRLGYRSEAAFARAFKRVMGTSPGAVKRRAAQSGSSGTSIPVSRPSSTARLIASAP